MICPRRFARAGALCLLLAIPATAQEPVVKPRRTIAPRLSSPAAVIARQLPDGRIEVRWARVDGAESYRITRSVPNLAPETALGPDPRDSMYVDGDVKAGHFYYYVVAGIDGSGQLGLKRGAAPVKAALSSGTGETTQASATPANYPLTPSPNAPGPVSIRLESPTLFVVSWMPARGASLFDIERRTYRGTATDSMRLDPMSGVVRKVGSIRASLPASFRDTIPAATYRRWVQYRIVAHTSFGQRDAGSQLLPIHPETTVQPVTTVPTTTNPLPTGTVAPGLEITVAVGQTATIPLAGGIPGAQWSSAATGIASVSASGAVTGRQPGVAPVIAWVPQADGSVLVGVARVTVIP